MAPFCPRSAVAMHACMKLRAASCLRVGVLRCRQAFRGGAAAGAHHEPRGGSFTPMRARLGACQVSSRAHAVLRRVRMLCAKLASVKAA
eukprot:6186721-Pleurochrysis_carterae.AAC.2